MSTDFQTPSRLDKLPFRVLFGFLCAGKAALPNHILNNREGRRETVIVNDKSEVNIDIALVRDSGTELSRTDEILVDMSKGCICCTLHEDLLVEADQFAKAGRFDLLVIESTRVAEPLPIAKTFAFESEDGRSLNAVARLDTIVTVVDAYNFLRDSSQDSLLMCGEPLGNEDQRTEEDLLTDQIEFCDVIVLNQTNLSSDVQCERLMTILRSLNSRARIEIDEFGKVSLNRLLDTGLSDFDEASKTSGWLQELRGTHKPVTEEYGSRNSVYRARQPFHPQRFLNLVESEGPGVVCAKGFFWLASHPTLAGSWAQVGPTVPPERWPQDPEPEAQIRDKWDECVGDSRQELVLTGMDMDEATLRVRFDTCLLTGQEIAQSPMTWTTWYNPFPDWS